MRRFEDSVAWQRSRAMTAAVYSATRTGDFARDFGLSGQIQRASVSVMSNIAEGFELYGDNQFHHALTIAKASCAEVRSQLYVALDIGYVTQKDFEALLNLNLEVSRLVAALRASVDRRRKGPDLEH